jgi:triacylglycerol lipase
MASMAKYLTKQGYRVHNIGYPSRKHDLNTLARDLAYGPLAGLVNDGRELHVVTHSMGGILLRLMDKYFPLKNLGHVVMLGPPNGGSEIADQLKDKWWFRWLLGPAAQELTTSPRSIPNRLGEVEFPLGVITGDRSWNPIFSKWIEGPNDGKVSVERAKVEGMKDFKVVRCGHTWIADRRDVQRATLHFLKHGWFEKSYS